MAYSDDIIALSPDHHWSMNNTAVDTGLSLDNRPLITGVSASYDTTPITEDSTHSLLIGSTTGRIECADVNDINGANNNVRVISGWISIPSLVGISSSEPTCLWKEGGSLNNIALFIDADGRLIMQAVAGSPSVFVLRITDPIVKVTKPLHVCMMFANNTNGDFFKGYIDGVEITSGIGFPPNAAYFTAHNGDVNFGSSDTTLLYGHVSYSNPVTVLNTRYAQWGSWTAVLTDAQIRDTLYGIGALAGHTVTNQTELDLIASSTINLKTCGIRVDVAGSISLDVDNITFTDCTTDIIYTGTGTLTIKNSNGSNASTSLAINGGTVDIVAPATITISGIVDDTEVRIYRVSDGVEITGVENSVGGSFLGTYDYTSNFDVNIVVHHIEYKYISFENFTLDGVNTTLPVTQVFDDTYSNP